MPAWTPADVRQKYSLTVSTAERLEFEARMAPLVRDAAGYFNADAVFEGGGVLGLAFLGAARCCHEFGIRWQALAGTSAGALAATLLAADLPIEQLEHIFGQFDILDFLSQKTSRLIFNGDPGDDLDHPVQLLTNLALIRELGQYSTAPFAQWLDETLRWAGVPTFGDIWDGNPRAPKDRQLKIVISDLTRGEMAVLPDDLEPPPEKDPSYRLKLTTRQRAFKVSEAVRLSISIPFFFEPGRLERPSGISTIVDGGILSNFPLWIYDLDKPDQQPPDWPTFGFRLVDRSTESPRAIDSVTGLLTAMLKTMMVAADRRYLSQRHLGRVIDIDLTELKLSATSFNLNNKQKDALYVQGFNAVKRFFTRDWNWAQHVQLRTGKNPIS